MELDICATLDLGDVLNDNRAGFRSQKTKDDANELDIFYGRNVSF